MTALKYFDKVAMGAKHVEVPGLRLSSIEVSMDKQPIRVLIVDDHAMVRKGMIALMAAYDDIQVIGEAANGAKAVELADQLRPDVILMDLSMPIMDGIEAIKQIVSQHPEQRIIVLTSYTGDDKLFPAIKAGALGYLVKDAQPEELIESIHNVYAGEPSLDQAVVWRSLRGMSDSEPTRRTSDDLSEREIEVLRLLSQGKTDQEIARELVLTDVTIRTHISRILSKLGLKNRVQAALYGIRTGLISLDDIEDNFTDSG
jgi:NarL family two-component system response regulator LiaR